MRLVEACLWCARFWGCLEAQGRGALTGACGSYCCGREAPACGVWDSGSSSGVLHATAPCVQTLHHVSILHMEGIVRAGMYPTCAHDVFWFAGCWVHWRGNAGAMRSLQQLMLSTRLHCWQDMWQDDNVADCALEDGESLCDVSPGVVWRIPCGRVACCVIAFVFSNQDRFAHECTT